MYEIPTTYTTDTSDLLYRWLGSFWTSICEDAELLRMMYKANGILSAQLYQEYADTLNLTNRNNIPVLQRNLWLPISLTLKDQNPPDKCGIKLNMDPAPAIGPQTDPRFGIGTLLKIGGPAVYEGVTAYALPDGVKDIIAVSNRIDNVSALYIHGVNFVVQDGAIYFLNNQDPFGNPEFDSTDIEIDGVDTKQLTIYAAEANIDKNYVYNHAGYVLGYKDVSSLEYKRAVNALWDVYNSGATVVNLKMAIAAMLDEPVIQTNEVVEFVVNNSRQVITDKHVYNIPEDAELRPEVKAGAKLTKGDLLTRTIRFYENLQPSRLRLNNPDIAELKEDVPALFLPAPFFRAQLDHGVGVTWELADIINQGHNKHNDIQYSFKVYGNTSDITKLWEDIWYYCEGKHKAMSELFTPYMHEAPDVVGAVSGKVMPLEFFMTNLLHGNMFILSINTSKLTTYGKANFHRLAMLRNVIPAHTYMFVIEKVDGINDIYELDEAQDDGIIQAAAQARADVAKAGIPSKRHLTYSDRLCKMKWVPTCL